MMGWKELKKPKVPLKKDDYWLSPEQIVHKTGLKVLEDVSI